MGQTDQDVTFSQIAQTKQVTIPPFFMDQTEITNSQYRKFVNWVRDSIAITNYLNDPKYFLQPAKGAPANPSGKKYINWNYVKKYPVMSPKRELQLLLPMLNCRECFTRAMTAYLTRMNWTSGC